MVNGFEPGANTAAMSDVAGPVTSEVVRRRLAELFAQLQEAPSVADAQPLAGRPVETLGSGLAGADAEEDWLAKLRAAPPSVAEPVRAESVAPGAARELVGRVRAFTTEHLATVVVVLLVGIGWTTYSLLQVRATPVADAAPRVESTSAGGGAATPAPTGKQVVVHVIGAVAKPGVVQLPDGSRVADAIAAAGGLARSGAVGELNLAQPLIDGTQLKIGTRKRPGGWIRDGTGSVVSGSNGGGSNGGGSNGAGPNGAGGQSTKISLNTATIQQLDTLPGIGPVTAAKIIDWRKAHGRFTAITELQEVDGIGPKTYADLADRVRL